MKLAVAIQLQFQNTLGHMGGRSEVCFLEALKVQGHLE